MTLVAENAGTAADSSKTAAMRARMKSSAAAGRSARQEPARRLPACPVKWRGCIRDSSGYLLDVFFRSILWIVDDLERYLKGSRCLHENSVLRTTPTCAG